MTHIEYVYAICCCPEVDDDVISSRNVKAFKVILWSILKMDSSSIYSKIHFMPAAEAAVDIDDSIKQKTLLRVAYKLTCYPARKK